MIPVFNAEVVAAAASVDVRDAADEIVAVAVDVDILAVV